MKNRYEVLNSKGQKVTLNPGEKKLAEYLQNQLKNSTEGYQIDITTLTSISKSIVEQKFFTIPPAEYMPVRVGEHAWSADILTYKEYSVGDDFATGIINTAASDSRLAEADTAVEGVRVPILNWAKQINWTIFDLKLASQSGNWDLVTAKERSRKKNWDLGIQKIAFLGLTGNANITGLLTLAGVTANTSVITEYINAMSAANFNAFVRTVVGTYRAACNYTAWPTHFVIPELDYNGLASFPDATYPLKTKLALLLEAFQLITRNPNFQILPCAYADEVNNTGILDKNRYTLLNYDEDTIRMDIPVDYSNTMQNTINGMQFQNVGYGQFTGTNVYRPREVLYFDFQNPTS